jgi:hypothetical protein
LVRDLSGVCWPQITADVSTYGWTDVYSSVTHCDDSCHVISPLVILKRSDKFLDKNEQDLRSGSPTCFSWLILLCGR